VLGFPHVAEKVVDSIALFLSFNEKAIGEPIDWASGPEILKLL